MNLDYLLFDIKRTLRNRRVLIFSILMPLILFVIFGMSLKQTDTEAGISAIAYVMVSMAMFGSLSAAMSSGGVIAMERDGGWNRTLRLTPLKPQAYVVTKVILSLLLAIPPLVVVFAAGMIFGHVHLSAGQWASVALVSWLGALPFAGLGLVIGYVAKPDSVQPITGLTTILIAAFGGLWLPVESMPSLMKHIAEFTPAYWTGLSSRSALSQSGLDMHALLVVLGWTVVLGAIGLRRFRADTARA
ncbi:ABC-2 type transport system permease protein [Kribbella orskensis]|uniref:Transport permease protein n=1 Tax=Kribbella orskensis TaxID=2512216 RepID=A0ABY2BUA3_9ACTN|nr:MULTISPECIES: ABC transporter permease [Kribbella]TCN44476.1 ABC-2 type transport system permease protein [Kribbella sp. VKM Ac-2500]TCO31746.1 ABC-2 type transport system permease protein [Kribbella orskensis]